MVGHYYSVFAYERPISRYAIRPISPSHCQAILQELSGIVTFDDHGSLVFNLTSTSLLSHIDMIAYTESDLLQRMFLLSLSHLALPLRNDMLFGNAPSQSLMRRIKDSRYLNYWMLSCSNCDEQYFLNTCDTAASLSSIVSYHACIASLIHMGRLVCAEVEKRCPLARDDEPAFPTLFGSVPSQLAYVSTMIANFRSYMDDLELMVLNILDGERQQRVDSGPSSSSSSSSSSPSSDERQELLPPLFDMNMVLERHELMRRWHKEMQRLSSIFFPDDPVVLTEKIFPNNWHKSAKVQTALAFLDQFLPGRPTFLSRSQASRSLEQIDCHYLHTQLALLEPEADNGLWLDFPWNVADETNPTERMVIMEKLWERIVHHDGLLISSRESLFFGFWTIGHLSYWKGVWLGPELEDRYFLISDPELRYFKVLTIAQAERFVADLNNLVNPTDGAVVQHYRTKKLCKEL